MTLETTPYELYENDLPQSGNHIIGQERDGNIIVYQAFNPHISNYAVEHQRFGGSHYSFGRMSWIKPNFLWMMYRAGWANKPHQQQILAIEISKINFEKILGEAVHASFDETIYGTRENWKAKLAGSKVRLQWDPDHNPYGGNLSRRAIQLGLKGETLHRFATDWIVSIEDITGFVHEQGKHVRNKNLNELLVIKERVVELANPTIREQIALS